jgi:iron complex outermembrane receptor protein
MSFEIRRRQRLPLLATSMMAGVAVNLLAPAAMAQTEAQPQANEANGISDIIVTANRRQERNQDVPIAITAFSPDRLEQQGIAKEQDLQASVPSLIVGPNGQGSRDAQSFTIRGQGATFQASPGVVVYMNEVPLPAGITLSQQGGPGNFVDLARRVLCSAATRPAARFCWCPRSRRTISAAGSRARSAIMTAAMSKAR